MSIPTLLEREKNNSNVSSKEDNLESEFYNNEPENSKEENESLEILAGEIYNSIQQRIEIERERQGNYYRWY